MFVQNNLRVRDINGRIYHQFNLVVVVLTYSQFSPYLGLVNLFYNYTLSTIFGIMKRNVFRMSEGEYWGVATWQRPLLVRAIVFARTISVILLQLTNGLYSLCLCTKIFLEWKTQNSDLLFINWWFNSFVFNCL